MAKLSFIGLGAMGSRIAKRLSTQTTAFQIHLYDTNSNAINSLESELSSYTNVFGSDSLHDAVSDSNYVISCLPNSSNVLTTIEECFKHQSNHLFAKNGCVWLDCTSGDAATSQTISNQYFASNKNLYFMDCPVSGGPAKAEQGTVSCMIGCDEDNIQIFEKCKHDVLQYISSNPVRVGNVGAGHSLKCINNLLNIGNLLLLSEGLQCAKEYGIEIETALNVINNSSGRSLMSQEWFPKHIIEKNYFYDFQLGLIKKDVQNAINLMSNIKASESIESNGHFPIANTVNRLLETAVDEYGYNADYTEATRLYIDLHRDEVNESLK